jgi:hypothetical protein
MNHRKINKLVRQLKQYDLACKETIQAIYSEVIEPTPKYLYLCRQHEYTSLNHVYAPYYAVFRTLSNGDDYNIYNKVVHKLQKININISSIGVANTSGRLIIFRFHQFIHSINYHLSSTFTPTKFRLNVPFEISDADWHKLIYNDIFPPNFIIEGV